MTKRNDCTKLLDATQEAIRGLSEVICKAFAAPGGLGGVLEDFSKSLNECRLTADGLASYADLMPLPERRRICRRTAKAIVELIDLDNELKPLTRRLVRQSKNVKELTAFLGSLVKYIPLAAGREWDQQIPTDRVRIVMNLECGRNGRAA
jgi:hypothetical protein